MTSDIKIDGTFKVNYSDHIKITDGIKSILSKGEVISAFNPNPYVYIINPSKDPTINPKNLFDILIDFFSENYDIFCDTNTNGRIKYIKNGEYIGYIELKIEDTNISIIEDTGVYKKIIIYDKSCVENFYDSDDYLQ